MITTKKTALIYCEEQFGLIDGKTAEGLIRQSDTYQIVGVLDSSLIGRDAGEVLGDKKSDIPIFANLRAALAWESPLRAACSKRTFRADTTASSDMANMPLARINARTMRMLVSIKASRRQHISSY